MGMTNEELLRKIEQFKAEKDQAAGAKAEILRQLKEEFGVNSLEDARALRNKFKEKHRLLEQKANQEKQKLEKEISKHEHSEEEGS